MQDVEALQSNEQASGEGSNEEWLKKVKSKALSAIDALMLTDAPLLFPPGQLALAALRSGLKIVILPT